MTEKEMEVVEKEFEKQKTYVAITRQTSGRLSRYVAYLKEKNPESSITKHEAAEHIFKSFFETHGDFES